MDVSIIIPVYNQEIYLRECLESVVSQNDCNYEVILVNDGSTDKSDTICREFVKKYSNFRYIYQENAGLGGARNTGLANARGKYLFFLDSDDAIQPSCIGKLFEYAEENAADIVYFDELVCDENLSVQSVAKTYPEMEVRIQKEKALEFAMHPSHIWARLYRRNLFDGFRFSSIWYEDMEIFPRLVAKAERLYYYKLPVYYYRQHKKGITHQGEDKRNLEVITAWRNAYTKADSSREERRSLEICIKKSIAIFIFFRPKYATAYAEFYNQLFVKKANLSSEVENADAINIRHMPLWQQADFYGRTEILDILSGLKELYQQGGILQFHADKTVDFQKEDVSDERIVFSSEGGVLLKEMRMRRGNSVVFEILRESAQWNLISLKNQMKEFKIAEIAIEKAMLNGIRIDGRV